MFAENEKIIILDTETTNDIECPFAYDIGFCVIDLEGKVYEEHSYVVADVFLNKELMTSAFFADKIPQYWEDIKSGKRKMRRFKTIKSILRDVCLQYGITKICAHNARFDNKSCNTTQRFLTCSKYRYFFPYGIEIWDSLKMAREIFKDDDDYGKFCFENGFMTKRNQRQYTAEVLYRYLTNNIDFVEEHTGLADCLIEKEIFCECYRRKNNINGALWG